MYISFPQEFSNSVQTAFNSLCSITERVQRKQLTATSENLSNKRADSCIKFVRDCGCTLRSYETSQITSSYICERRVTLDNLKVSWWVSEPNITPITMLLTPITKKILQIYATIILVEQTSRPLNFPIILRKYEFIRVYSWPPINTQVPKRRI